ncbi:Hypothetical predicted protein [Paramuricea clavata]|uniref:Uncharacterized protein n=1 Tax=Paramuricea clavata TaxID=317549 RepID=A0A6S7GUW8_PARCT|nr:Hypothetical predicted protein [Paramuricea clavata]
MSEALKTRVPGLGETTIKYVFGRLFKQHGCICLPFGGSVRGIDADTRYTLAPAKAQPKLQSKPSQSSSQSSSQSPAKAPAKAQAKSATMQIMHISEQNEADGEEIDLANWKKTFFGELTNL